MKREIITTADGSKTIFLPEMREQFHSINGAVTESAYVFIENGYVYHQTETPVVLEIGFGTGLNCLLTALQAEKQKRKTLYYTIDNNILNQSIIQELEYAGINPDLNSEKIFETIHTCKWGIATRITEYFEICKLKVDFTSEKVNNFGSCNIIYFDAFAPDKQPEMWTPEIFTKIAHLTTENGVFVTYSAKGEVRRQLNKAGFIVERLPGPPGKKEMLRGRKLKSIT